VRDVLDHVLGGRAASEDALRWQRADTFAGIQANYEALTDQVAESGLTESERLSISLRVAAAHRNNSLTEWYGDLLSESGASVWEVASIIDGTHSATGRLAPLLDYSTTVAVDPASVGAERIAALAAAGFTEREIVTVSQLIGFVSYFSRIISGLEALRAAS